MLQARLVDTHAHLDSSIYEHDLDVVVRTAEKEGVVSITVGNDYASSVRAIQLAEKYPSVYAAIGLHPNRIPVTEDPEAPLVELDRFNALAAHPKVVAIGETGLDFHDLSQEYRMSPGKAQAERIKNVQKKVFGRFLQLAQEHRLPLLLHCRDAHQDMLEMLETWDRATPGFDARGIVHAFTGTWKDARRYFNLEFLVSVTGLITHGAYQTELIRKAPLSQLVLESDCPYVTPVPWALRRNEPSYLALVAQAVAGMRGTTVEEVATQTTFNCRRMFRKMQI
jgi:TatD DNase family protein